MESYALLLGSTLSAGTVLAIAALGLLISALLSMRGLQSAPGGWRTYLDLPGDRS